MNKIPPFCSVPPCSSLFSHFFASIRNANRFWNNGQILTFKVSKRPYPSSPHDEIICRWRHHPLVVKIGTKQPWVKIENLRNFDRNFMLFRGKIWLWLFYKLFCVMVLKFYTKNLKSFQPKMKGWRQFFQILISFLIWKINVTPSFLLEITWNLLCKILEPQCKRVIK